MIHRFASRTRGFLVVLALAGLVGSVGVAADQDELPPIERMKEDLVGIQKNLTNANMKLKLGMSGVSSAGAEGETAQRPPTPAESCCSGNLERMNKKLHLVTRTLEQLDVYYAERRNSEALAVLDQIRGEVNVVARGVAIFQMAGTTGRAQQALDGIIRPFHRLREAIEQLEACCPVDAAAAAKLKKRP
jgi:hypothetical protein